LTENVKIKIVGNKNAVTKVLIKIKTLYPMNVTGQVLDNDNDPGCHVFITVPEEA
jgi:hypothetical protein